MYKNGLIRKVNFKIYDVTAWLTIEIHILLNISRSKRNQTIEFGQLIKYNIVNTVVEKNHTQNVAEKIFPALFLRNQNWVYLCINGLKFLCCMFSLYVNLRATKIYWNQAARPLNFTFSNAFLKNKKRSRTSLPASFFSWFLE